MHSLGLLSRNVPNYLYSPGNSIYLFIYLLYGLNKREVIHCNSKISQKWERYVLLLESRFNPLFNRRLTVVITKSPMIV